MGIVATLRRPRVAGRHSSFSPSWYMCVPHRRFVVVRLFLLLLHPLPFMRYYPILQDSSILLQLIRTNKQTNKTHNNKQLTKICRTLWFVPSSIADNNKLCSLMGQSEEDDNLMDVEEFPNNGENGNTK